ncbi:MAG TPA: hypothetical protein VHB21_10620, partial [Minicystis sp.]|nr:hypothetical protein [Minicystis sp.]
MKLRGVRGFSAAAALALAAAGCRGGGDAKPRPAPTAVKQVASQAVKRARAVPPPPPPVTMPPRLPDGSYTWAGLHYLEKVTGGAKKNDALPLVVMLHGHGQSPERFFHAFDDFHGRARFIFPYGRPEGAGYAWLPPRASHHDMLPQLTHTLPPEANRIARAIQAIAAKRPTTGKPIVVGFSQGATLSYGLALLHPDAITAAFPVSGTLPPQLMRGRQRRSGPLPEVHGFHGTADRAVD